MTGQTQFGGTNNLAALANPCPRCGAKPGEPCLTIDGRGEEMRTVGVMHIERKRGHSG